MAVIAGDRRCPCGTPNKGYVGDIGLHFTKGGEHMAEDRPPPQVSSLPLPLAYQGAYQVQPLPFDPTKLTGLSEKLLVSHHQNNYGGAVRRLNQIQQQLGHLPPDAPPYQRGSLKREELIATNSMLLHESYFGNLGKDGKASRTAVDLISAAYGTFDAWEHDFRVTGMALAEGSGWVILHYNPRDHAVHNYWAWDHTHSLAWGMPLLVMDMYEHAYHIDYGANTGGYVDAFFRNIQ